MDYLREHPEIHEVILSGGEPLMQADAQLARLLSNLRSLDRAIAIRIHTRALTFNPFRVTDDLSRDPRGVPRQRRRPARHARQRDRRGLRGRRAPPAASRAAPVRQHPAAARDQRLGGRDRRSRHAPLPARRGARLPVPLHAALSRLGCVPHRGPDGRRHHADAEAPDVEPRRPRVRAPASQRQAHDAAPRPGRAAAELGGHRRRRRGRALHQLARRRRRVPRSAAAGDGCRPGDRAPGARGSAGRHRR